MTSSRRASAAPRRGEVWFVGFDPAPPAQGHEQAYPRPALVISVDLFNAGGSELAAVLPITRTDRRNPLHVPLHPPEGGVRHPSFVLCDQITTVAHARLQYRVGALRPATLATVARVLRIVLGL